MRFTSLLVAIAALIDLSAAASASAGCNLIPVARSLFPSTLGAIEDPITAPGRTVTLGITPCDASPGFEPIAADNVVELGFEPPGPGADTVVPISTATVSVSDCVLPGGRCGTLTFETPDTTSELPPDGLAGPARIVVRDSGNAVVAQIGTLFQPASSCDREPETVFHQFTVLPVPNSFADATNGAAPVLRATVDGGGDLLVPFDYWGGGTNSVLAESPGAPVAIFLEGEADLGAESANDPTSLLHVIASQPSPSSFVRSFTLNGRPLPPLLRVTSNGTLLGTSDAVESTLRIARRKNPDDPPLFDLSDRLFMGRGPVIISSFTTQRQSPVPLKSLRSSSTTVAFARDESREGVILNGDGDMTDEVMTVVDADTGATLNTGRAVTESSPLLPNSFGFSEEETAVPVVDVSGDLVAFLESEEAQGVDRNLDLDMNDSFLRVFTRSGEELTAALPPIEAAPVSLVNGRPLVISGSRVFFRGPNPFVELQQDGVGPVTGLADPVDAAVSPDGAHLYVVSNSDVSLTTFARDATSGRLTFLDATTLSGKPTALALSPDGKNVYVTIDSPIGTLAVYTRNTLTGGVTFLQSQVDDTGGVSGLGLARDVAVSPDGANVYVAAPGDNAVAVFTRSGLTGALTFLQVLQQGVGGVSGLIGVQHVVVTPNGVQVFTGPARFSRSPADGSLTYCGADVEPAWSNFAISPDGQLAMRTGSSFATYTMNYPCNSPSFGGNFPPDSAFIDGEEQGPAVAIDQDVAISADGARTYAVGASIPSALTTFVSGSGPNRSVPTYAGTALNGLSGVRGLSMPRSITLSPDGRFAYVTAQLEQAVSVFQNDLTLRVFDAESRTVLSEQPQATLARVAGERAVILTNEALAGTDLDGDGLRTHEVAQIYDATKATPRVVSLAVPATHVTISDTIVALTTPSTENNNLSNADALLVGDPKTAAVAPTGFGASRIAAGTSELVFADRDYSGVTNDSRPVLHFYDPKKGQATNPGSLLFVDSYAIAGSLVAFLAAENTENQIIDYNGDGDQSDVVMFVHDLDTGETINTGHAGLPCTIPGACQQFRPFAIDTVRRTVTFLEREADQGATDLNGDHDANDLVLQVYALRAQKSQIVATIVSDEDPDQHESLGEKLPPFPERNVQDDIVSHRRRESEIGVDVNDDGVIDDAIAHFVAGDSDGDGLYDDSDNCREAVNPDGLDVDADNLGDSACDPDPSVCPPAPLVGCGGAPSGKASLSITNSAVDTKDALQWKWGKGAATTLADFGNPVTGLTHYSLCVYDGSGSAQPIMRAAAVAQAVCGARPCWKTAGSKGYGYKDKVGHGTGVRQLKLGAGTLGKAKIALAAKGAQLHVSPLPVVTPLTVQLVVREGIREACWTATYSTAKTSDATHFKAVSD